MAGFPAPTKTYHKKAYPAIDPTRPEISAKGKTIVITGGGTGIGAETARYFAKAGASRIAILGRREQPLLDTKAKIESESPGTEVLAIPADMSNGEQVEAAFKKAAGGGKIDVLLSNAAVVGKQANISKLTTEEFMWGVVTNLQGNFNLTKAFLAHAAKDASIIETNSAAAHMTMSPGISVYNVSKAATARLYRTLAFENPEIATFSVQPGVVETDMSREAGYKPKKEGEEFMFEGEGSTALASFDDVSLPAGFFVWLASPEGRFLKGKFLWANWDVEELKEREREIEGGLLELGLVGWPFGMSESFVTIQPER